MLNMCDIYIYTSLYLYHDIYIYHLIYVYILDLGYLTDGLVRFKHIILTSHQRLRQSHRIGGERNVKAGGWGKDKKCCLLYTAWL